MVSGFFVPLHMIERMRARRHTMVMLNTEVPYQDGEQLEQCALVDVALLNDPVTIDAYRAVCPVAEYVPHAYRPSVHHPWPQKPRYDLVFAGTGYQSRIDFFHGMNLNRLKVALAGNWLPLAEDDPLQRFMIHESEHCIDNEQTAELYRQAKAGINFYRREAAEDGTSEGWAIGPREVEMAACGLWFLRDPRPEGDQLFPALPTFTDAGQAGEMLRWALKRDTLRAAAADAAREAVRDRTFSNNARMLLRLLDRQPVTI